MFDEALELFHDDTMTAAGAPVDETGTAVELPQGFPRSGLALVVLVQTAGGGGQDLAIALEYSIDEGVNWLNACETIYTDAQSGVRTERWAANLLDLVADGFDTTQIQVRAKLDALSSTSDWGRVYVYLTPVGY